VSDAEIRDPHGPVRGDHDVRRLDVPVDKPRAVRGLQARRHLGDDVHGPRRIQGAIIQHAFQRRPLDQFHHQVGLAGPGLTVVIDPRDVLVRQRSGVQRLGLEPGPGFWLMGVGGMQQLDRDRPRQHRIGGSPHRAVPARTDYLIKQVTIIENRRAIAHLCRLPSPLDPNHGLS
jgi:hypothetical protein